MTESQINQHVFIGGCSRSGTTLLGSMLGSHTDFICSPESHFKIDILRSISRGTPADPDTLLGLIKQYWRFKIWELDLPSTFPETIDSYPSLLNWIVTQYAQQQNKPDATSWVDHTPENISYVSSLLELFPNAKMIHIIRDGRAVAASILPLDWGPNSIIKAAHWWVRMTAFGLAAEVAYGPTRVMRVRYEELVQEPEQTLRNISAFLDIAYQPAMMKATGFNPPSYTSRQHKLVGDKPNTTVINRWENVLTQRQVEIFENLTRDFLTYMGYACRYGLEAKTPSFFEVQKGSAVELWRSGISNKFRWLRRSYPLWLSRDFYSKSQFTDTNN